MPDLNLSHAELEVLKQLTSLKKTGTKNRLDYTAKRTLRKKAIEASKKVAYVNLSTQAGVIEIFVDPEIRGEVAEKIVNLPSHNDSFRFEWEDDDA